MLNCQILTRGGPQSSWVQLYTCTC